MSKITLQTEGDTHVVVTRRFAAPPEAVYRAHTDRSWSRNGCSARKVGRCPYASVRQSPVADPLRVEQWQRRGIHLTANI